MIQSRPVEVDGRFVGVAVQASAQWHFVAVDPALEDLHGCWFPNPSAAEAMARQVLARARRPLRPWRLAA
jgi:hypothetical protein